MTRNLMPPSNLIIVPLLVLVIKKILGTGGKAALNFVSRLDLHTCYQEQSSLIMENCIQPQATCLLAVRILCLNNKKRTNHLACPILESAC